MYTLKKIRELEASEPNKRLILEYKEPDDFTFKGPFLSGYTSTSGYDCVSIGSFSRSLLVENITGHYFEYMSPNRTN